MFGKYEPPKHKRFDRLPDDVKAAVESSGLATDGKRYGFRRLLSYCVDGS